MKGLIFALRNLKELMRDPSGLVLSLGTPALLIALISFVAGRTEGMAEMLSIGHFVPGMLALACSFLTLFLGTLMASDKSTAYWMRLLCSPLRSGAYLLGYGLPVLPLGLAQLLLCLLSASLFGLPFTLFPLTAIFALIPTLLLHIGMGLLLGSLFDHVGLLSGFGAVWIGATVFLSGTLIPVSWIGGPFAKMCNVLPFLHCNELLIQFRRKPRYIGAYFVGAGVCLDPHPHGHPDPSAAHEVVRRPSGPRQRARTASDLSASHSFLLSLLKPYRKAENEPVHLDVHRLQTFFSHSCITRIG